MGGSELLEFSLTNQMVFGCLLTPGELQSLLFPMSCSLEFYDLAAVSSRGVTGSIQAEFTQIKNVSFKYANIHGPRGHGLRAGFRVPNSPFSAPSTGKEI